MSNSPISVPIKNIDSKLQGPPLNSEISHCFEEAYSSFISKKAEQEDAEEIINEMGNLLTVSQENLEKVQNQKWFKRAWHTVTGKNKKLERINQSNLLKVQKGALFFLQNLAELNEQMMETVAFTLQRIEDIQIENSKLKGYLIQIVQKYNKKINSIENKLDEHDKAIRILQHSSKRYIYLIFGIIILVVAIISFLFSPTSYKWFISILSVLLSIPFFVLFFHRNPISEFNIQTQIPEESYVRNENNKHFPKIAKLIYNLYVDFVNENLISAPYQQFFEKNEILSSFYSELNTNGIDKPTIGKVVKKILAIEPETIKNIDNNVKQSSNIFCDFHRKLVTSIHQEFLPNSIGLDVLSSLDFNFQSVLGGNLLSASNPYCAQFDQIAKTRKTLLNQYNQFNDLMNESVWKEGAKAFFEGFTFGLVDASSKDEIFINEFIENLSYYGQQWDNIAPIIHNSVIQLNANIYDESIRYSINSMQPLFDEFNNQNISVLPLLNQLRNGSE